MSPSLPPLRRAMRAALVTLLAVVITACLAVVVFGTVDLIAQLTQGTTLITLRADPPGWTFSFTGPGGVTTEGYEVELTSAIFGLSAGATAVGALAIVAGLLTWVVLAFASFALMRGIRVGQPFDRRIVRQVAMAGVALLVLGTASQLLGWWATNLALDEFGETNNEWLYVRGLNFQPLTVAIGLTLLLAALAFRAGERLQRDAEGLI